MDAALVDQAQATQARYCVRWANGYWCLFDSVPYCAVAIFPLRAWADEEAWAANNGMSELIAKREAAK